MKTYASPVAFRTALNARLRSRAGATSLPVNRVRTLAVMERFLARVVAVFPPTTVLKGGLAPELRLETAARPSVSTCGSRVTRGMLWF